MRVLVLDGDPQEVTEALKNLGLSSSPSPNALGAPSTSVEESGEDAESEQEDQGLTFISTPLARKVLNRIQLKAMPKQMLTEIYSAGDTGILGFELAKKLGYTSAQFRGMMGAFGRRLVNTPGYNSGYFFDYEWDDEKGTYRYWLRDTVREAVRIEIIDKK